MMLMMMTLIMRMTSTHLSPPATALRSFFWFLLPVRPRRVRKPDWLIAMLKLVLLASDP